jgi:release factor glutamine methyltransferase
MRSSNKRAFFSDLVFEVSENVYEPSEDTFLFAENLYVKPNTRVLDMGTGSGILGINAAKKAAEVLAVDINPHALLCAKQNAKLNGVKEKMEFLRSDLFLCLDAAAKFDLILFNSPYLPSDQGEDETWLSRSWAGGHSGRHVIDRFIPQAADHLETSGEILLLQSTLANADKTREKFGSVGLDSEIVARKALPFFETLLLFKAWFGSKFHNRV